MAENGRLPIFERWAEQYDQSVQTDNGIFASYDQVLLGIVHGAWLNPIPPYTRRRCFHFNNERTENLCFDTNYSPLSSSLA
jgi:hypothetical protein